MNTWLLQSAWADPFRDLRRFQDDVNRLFTTFTENRGQDFPLINLWAGEDGIVVSAELPGIDPEKVNVSVHKNTLTLSGERPAEKPIEGTQVLRRERFAGRFSRTVTLPFLVDPNQVKARTDAGVLLVHLPRPEADKPKRIQIAAA